MGGLSHKCIFPSAGVDFKHVSQEWMIQSLRAPATRSEHSAPCLGDLEGNRANTPSPFLARQKKGFSFFSCGVTRSRAVPKTQPLQVAFSILERVDLRSQKEGIWGKKIAWGRVGWRGQKKGKKDAQKKGEHHIHHLLYWRIASILGCAVMHHGQELPFACQHLFSPLLLSHMQASGRFEVLLQDGGERVTDNTMFTNFV